MKLTESNQTQQMYGTANCGNTPARVFRNKFEEMQRSESGISTRSLSHLTLSCFDFIRKLEMNQIKYSLNTHHLQYFFL